VLRCSPRILQARRSEHVILARTASNSSRRARGLRVIFVRDLEDALLQQEVGDDLLERAQSLCVRVGHHPELLVPSVEGRGGDVELSSDLGLAPAGLVFADGPDPGLLRLALLAHVLWHGQRFGVVGNPRSIISTGTSQRGLPIQLGFIWSANKPHIAAFVNQLSVLGQKRALWPYCLPASRQAMQFDHQRL